VIAAWQRLPPGVRARVIAGACCVLGVGVALLVAARSLARGAEVFRSARFEVRVTRAAPSSEPLRCVVRAANGAPIEGVTIEVDTGSGPGPRCTDASGEATVPRAPVPSRVWIGDVEVPYSATLSVLTATAR
jgi:hypothetical protein